MPVQPLPTAHLRNISSRRFRAASSGLRSSLELTTRLITALRRGCGARVQAYPEPLAEIRPLLVDHSFCHGLSALVGRGRVEKRAHATRMKLGPAAFALGKPRERERQIGKRRAALPALIGLAHVMSDPCRYNVRSDGSPLGRFQSRPSTNANPERLPELHARTDRSSHHSHRTDFTICRRR
jgi:hypothetical protein